MGARHTRLDGYAISGFQVCDRGAGPDDFACSFVAETVVVLDFERPNTACMPKVHVGAADAIATHSDYAVCWMWVERRGRSHEYFVFLVGK